MNWKSASDVAGIKPNALYAVVRDGKIYNGIWSELFTGSNLINALKHLDDDWNIAKYAEITTEEENMETHVEWKPIEELTEWPEVAEGQIIIIAKNGWICWIDDDTTVDFIKKTYGHIHYAVINLPRAPERKLKACPWCKVIPCPIDPLNDGNVKYYHIKHTTDCPIRNTTCLLPHDADKWGLE
jgi:hypothetical protein